MLYDLISFIISFQLKGVEKGKVFLVRYVKEVPFFDGRYTKGVPSLSKMVFKWLRGRTSGRSVPV